jgi:hypothetical protein
MINEPLTPAEMRNLGIANFYAMDVECEGGTLPPRIAEITHGNRKLTPAESREIIAWAAANVAGSGCSME